MANLLQKLQNTTLNNQKSLMLLSKLIRKEFDATKDEDRAFELLLLAYKYQVPQLEEMLSDYQLKSVN